jgi:[ribosomal protein S5]-alanine N-acetyltransferase
VALSLEATDPLSSKKSETAVRTFETVRMSGPYFMKTERVGFREWSEGDLPIARLLWGNQRVTEFIGGPFSEEQIIRRLSFEMQNQKEFGIQYWPIFLLNGDTHLGCAGLRPYDKAPNVFELGVHLLPEYWQKGLAEETTRAVIRFALSDLGATALFAGHHPENEASRRLLVKLGFRFTHGELYPATGRVHPSYMLNRS